MAKSKAKQAVEYAREQREQTDSWTMLHNALFGIGGALGTLFPTRKERDQFVGTPEYREITAMINELREQGSAGSGDGKDFSGRFVLRVPKSVHAALAAEAEAEGVSLNQLCLSKLSVELRSVV